MIRKSVAVGGGRSITILVNENECGICHRQRVDCDARPWPNHRFQPDNCDARQVPGRWLLQPIIDETELDQHRLGRPRTPRDHLAPVINLNANQEGLMP